VVQKINQRSIGRSNRSARAFPSPSSTSSAVEMGMSVSVCCSQAVSKTNQANLIHQVRQPIQQSTRSSGRLHGQKTMSENTHNQADVGHLQPGLFPAPWKQLTASGLDLGGWNDMGGGENPALAHR